MVVDIVDRKGRALLYGNWDGRTDTVVWNNVTFAGAVAAVVHFAEGDIRMDFGGQDYSVTRGTFTLTMNVDFTPLDFRTVFDL